MKLLDLFCGAGGAGEGYHHAGFDVTGVDLYPQPRNPHRFVQADVFTFLRAHWRDFDVIHASPPCQAYTNARKIRGRGHPDLIGPLRAMLIATGLPYIIENVPSAPLLGPVELCGTMFGLRTYRHRLFEASFPLPQLPHPEHRWKTTKMGRPPREDEFIHVVGHFSGIAEARKAMGIDWMTRDELAQAIPPAYTRFVGQKLIDKDL